MLKYTFLKKYQSFKHTLNDVLIFISVHYLHIIIGRAIF